MAFMWPLLSIAFEAGILSVVGYFVLARARAPNNPSGRGIITMNVLCVVAAAIFAEFFDGHGRAPALALAIAALEPLVLAGIMWMRVGERRVS